MDTHELISGIHWRCGRHVAWGPAPGDVEVDSVRGYLPGLPPGYTEWRGLRFWTLGTGAFPQARWLRPRVLRGSPRLADRLATALHEPLVWADAEEYDSLSELRLCGRVIYFERPPTGFWPQVRQRWFVWRGRRGGRCGEWRWLNDCILVVERLPAIVRALPHRWAPAWEIGIDVRRLETLRRHGLVERTRDAGGTVLWRLPQAI